MRGFPQSVLSHRAADLLPVIEAIKTEGAVTLREIASALDERGIRAPRGGAWSAVQVQRVLKAACDSEGNRTPNWYAWLVSHCLVNGGVGLHRRQPILDKLV